MGRRTFSREPYEDYFNKEVISLSDQLEKLEEEQERISNRILEIQKNCDHEYMLYSKGTHEDSYRCKHCGNYEWK